MNSRLIIFALLAFALPGCDMTEDRGIQRVDSQDRLSDTALQEHLQQNRQKNTATEQNTYFFGFDLRASPQEDAAQYIPFLGYLEYTTGYRFKLKFTPKNSSTIEELGRNQIQFAAMGATSFLEARSRYGAISLARGINHQGKAEYRAVFVARPDSPISSIEDIKNHNLAFGNRNSTQGHLIPRIMLNEHGIALDELRSYGYTGSHQNCAEAVVSGKYDVCGMQDQLAEKLAGEGQLKIIHTSRYYPSSGIVANKHVPEKVIEHVKQALLDFEPEGKHGQTLYNWDRTEMPGGFQAAAEGDYAELLQWSVRLGFLQGPAIQANSQ